MAKMYKVSVNLPESVIEAWRAYADQEDITMTEALRRAISIQKFLDERLRNNGKLLIKTGDQIRQVMV